MTEKLQNTRLSKSVLHDITKSVITYFPPQIMEICRHTPIKNSKILSGKTWKFVEARQECINVKYRQADVVWFFEDENKNNFFIVHEIKTGFFDIADIHRKYHTGMNVQIWIWTFKDKIPKIKPPVTIKIIPIEYIFEFVCLCISDSLDQLKRCSNA